MKTVYFARHGECVANAERRIAGSRNDSPLTELGIKQADETAESLKDLKIDLIISSPLSRAKDTARRIAEKLDYKGKIRLEKLMEERDFGAVSGELAEVGFPKVDAGEVDDLETLEDFAERMQRALELLKDIPEKTILVVGHSGAERMMRTLYEGRPFQTFLETEVLPNGLVRKYQMSS